MHALNAAQKAVQATTAKDQRKARGGLLRAWDVPYLIKKRRMQPNADGRRRPFSSSTALHLRRPGWFRVKSATRRPRLSSSRTLPAGANLSKKAAASSGRSTLCRLTCTTDPGFTEAVDDVLVLKGRAGMRGTSAVRRQSTLQAQTGTGREMQGDKDGLNFCLT